MSYSKSYTISHFTEVPLCSLPSPSLKPACSGVELPAQSFCHAHCWNLPALLFGAIHVVTLLLDSEIIWRESGPLPLLHNCVQNSKFEL